MVRNKFSVTEIRVREKDGKFHMRLIIKSKTNAKIPTNWSQIENGKTFGEVIETLLDAEYARLDGIHERRTASSG